jgi:hypothetical protein
MKIGSGIALSLAATERLGLRKPHMVNMATSILNEVISKFKKALKHEV